MAERSREKDRHTDRIKRKERKSIKQPPGANISSSQTNGSSCQNVQSSWNLDERSKLSRKMDKVYKQTVHRKRKHRQLLGTENDARLYPEKCK